MTHLLNCSRNSPRRRMRGMNWGVVTATTESEARSESISAVRRNNDESTFDERGPQGETKTALDQI